MTSVDRETIADATIAALEQMEETHRRAVTWLTSPLRYAADELPRVTEVAVRGLRRVTERIENIL